MKFYLNFLNERTPLHIAVAQGNPEIVKILLECLKIDPNGLSI